MAITLTTTNFTIDISTYDFVPVSPFIITFYKIWLKLFLFFTTITYTICLYVQLRHTPTVMGIYKYFMMWNSNQAFLTIVYLNLAELESILPCPVVLITGPVKLIGNLGKPVEFFLITVFILNLVSYMCVESAMFLYRYSQLSDNWLQQYITKHKYALPCNIGSETVGTIMIMGPLWSYYDGSEVIKEIFGKVIKRAGVLEDATPIGLLVNLNILVPI